MEWSEIDWESKGWVIIEFRVKQGKEHRIPLRSSRESEFVFDNASGGKLPKDAISQMFRRLEIKSITYGLRSTFRSWAAELSRYRKRYKVGEKVLAHHVDNAVEREYVRADYI